MEKLYIDDREIQNMETFERLGDQGRILDIWKFCYTCVKLELLEMRMERKQNKINKLQAKKNQLLMDRTIKIIESIEF